MNRWMTRALRRFTLGSQLKAHFAFVDKNSRITHEKTDICHAGLRWGSFPRHECKDFRAVITEISHEHNYSYLSEISKLKYYSWLFNRSFFSNCYINKDAGDVLLSRVQFITMDVPTNILMAAHITLRYAWEETKVVNTWYDLVCAGVDEDFAFVIAHCVAGKYDDNDNLDRSAYVSTSCHNSNHTIFGDKMSVEKARNFLKHEAIDTMPNTYRDYLRIGKHEDFGLINTLFGQPGSYGYMDDCNNFCYIMERFIELKKGASCVINPFAKTSTGRRYPYKHLIDDIVDKSKLLLEEINK